LSLSVPLLDLGQDALAGGEIIPPGLGQDQPAGRAVQQLDAEPVLQRGDVLRHHGLRQAQRPPRRREASEGRNANESLHAGDPVEHSYLTPMV
jgi:hypothetical protein